MSTLTRREILEAFFGKNSVTLFLKHITAPYTWVFIFMLAFTVSLGSETITMRTWYPSPYGSYNRLLTTGNTVLARDSGSVAIGTNTASTFKMAVNGGMYADGYDMRVYSYNDLLNGTQPSRPGKLVYVNDTDQYYYSTNNPKANDPTTWYKPVSAKAQIVAVVEGPAYQYVLDKWGNWGSTNGYPGYYVAPWHWDSKYTKLQAHGWPWVRYNADGMEMLNIQLTGDYCLYNGHNFDTSGVTRSSYSVNLQYWGIYEYYSGWVVYGLGQIDLNEQWTGPDGKPYLCGKINASGSVKTYDGVYGTYFYVYQYSVDDGAYYIQAWQNEWSTLWSSAKYNNIPGAQYTGNPYCLQRNDERIVYGDNSCNGGGGYAAYHYQVPHITRNMKLTLTKMF